MWLSAARLSWPPDTGAPLLLAQAKARRHTRLPLTGQRSLRGMAVEERATALGSDHSVVAAAGGHHPGSTIP